MADGDVRERSYEHPRRRLLAAVGDLTLDFFEEAPTVAGPRWSLVVPAGSRTGGTVTPGGMLAMGPGTAVPRDEWVPADEWNPAELFGAGCPAPLDGATFEVGVLSTPDSSVAGQSANPLVGMDTARLLQRGGEPRRMLGRTGVTDADDVAWLVGPDAVSVDGPSRTDFLDQDTDPGATPASSAASKGRGASAFTSPASRPTTTSPPGASTGPRSGPPMWPPRGCGRGTTCRVPASSRWRRSRGSDCTPDGRTTGERSMYTTSVMHGSRFGSKHEGPDSYWEWCGRGTEGNYVE